MWHRPHFIDHACHTAKGAKGKVYAAGFIYSLNLRNELLKPLCCVTNGTTRHQEIPALRNYIEKQNSETNKPKKHLYVYDKRLRLVGSSKAAWKLYDHRVKRELGSDIF